jgi:hypothetical protein
LNVAKVCSTLGRTFHTASSKNAEFGLRSG